MKVEFTPWFGADVMPARNGVYEIQGARFEGKNFRYWNGRWWGGTWGRPSRTCQMDCSDAYAPGEDMTGWRGLTYDPKETA